MSRILEDLKEAGLVAAVYDGNGKVEQPESSQPAQPTQGENLEGESNADNPPPVTDTPAESETTNQNKPSEPKPTESDAPVTDNKPAEGVDSGAELFKSELEKLKKENELLNLKLSKREEFANPEIRKFNGFVKNTGIDNFGVYQKIKNVTREDIKRNPIDVLVTSEILKNPEHADKEAYFRGEVLRSYGLNSDSDFAELENDETKTRLEINASRAYKEIEEYQSKIGKDEEPDYESLLEEDKAKAAEAKNALAPVLDNALKSGMGAYVVKESDKDENPFKFVFDEKTQAQMKEQVLEIMSKEKDPYNEDVFKRVVGQVYHQAASANLGNILKAYGNSIRESVAAEFRKQRTNPTDDTSPPAQGDGTPQTAQEQIEEFIHRQSKQGWG